MIGMCGHWLMEQGFFERAVEGYLRFEPTPEQIGAFIETRSRTADENAEFFIRDGDVARIPVVGALTKTPDFFFDLFGSGSTVYGDIVAGIRAAEADDAIKRIVFEIDSPGGEMTGFFETAAAIADATKPTEAQVSDMAMSAAFGLASQADKVIVNNRGAMVGSVGIVTTIRVSDSLVTITSSDAPNKRPDVTTDAGVAIVVAQLDPIHEEFAGVIATGRDVSLADVNANFGRGGVVIASVALQAGMIDGILEAGETRGGSSTGTSASSLLDTDGDIMTTLEELRATHPALAQALIAEGYALGVADERDRVTAHMEAGEACGDLTIAAGYIVEGTDYTRQAVQARYATASANRDETTGRADDNDTAPATPAAQSAEGDGAADADANTNAIFDALETGHGITPEARA